MSAGIEQYVELAIGGQRYAVRIEEISEIIKPQHITAIPGSRSSVLGVTNIRGNMVPIISLRARLGLAEAPSESAGRIVVVPYGGEHVGIQVDEASRVVRFRAIQPAEGQSAGPNAFECEGVGHTHDGLVGIVRIERMLEGASWRES